MTVKHDVIIYEAKPVLDLKDLYDISFISTDGFTRMPFRHHTSIFLPNIKPKFGDMFEIKDGKTWNLKTLYNIHTYELVTVLGKRDNDLLVYGKKIDEIKLRNFHEKAHDNNAAFDVQRGDELLLNEYTSGKFTILHNITQAKLKYEANNR